MPNQSERTPDELNHQAANQLDGAAHASNRFELLCEAMQDPDELVCQDAALALGKLAKEDPAIRSQVIGIMAGILGQLDHPDWFLRRNAAIAIGESGDSSPRSVEALIDGLRGPGIIVYEEAVKSLAAMNVEDIPEAQAAIPNLEKISGIFKFPAELRMECRALARRLRNAAK